MPASTAIVSTRRVTRRLRRTMRATSPMSGRSSPSAHPSRRRRGSGSDAEALEAIAVDRVLAHEAGALLGVHPRRLAQAVRDGARMGPCAVGVRVVALEQQVLDADLVAAAQRVRVVEDAPVDAALGVRRGRLRELDTPDTL